MFIEGVLYEGDNVRVTYLHSPKNPEEVISREDYELWLRKGGEWGRYIIQRGILREMLRADNAGLVRMIRTFNPEILAAMQGGGISVNKIKEAVAGACSVEDAAFDEYLRSTSTT